MTYNRVDLTGRLDKPPEIKADSLGREYCVFSLRQETTNYLAKRSTVTRYKVKTHDQGLMADIQGQLIDNFEPGLWVNVTGARKMNSFQVDKNGNYVNKKLRENENVKTKTAYDEHIELADFHVTELDITNEITLVGRIEPKKENMPPPIEIVTVVPGYEQNSIVLRIATKETGEGAKPSIYQLTSDNKEAISRLLDTLEKGKEIKITGKLLSTETVLEEDGTQVECKKIAHGRVRVSENQGNPRWERTSANGDIDIAGLIPTATPDGKPPIEFVAEQRKPVEALRLRVQTKEDGIVKDGTRHLINTYRKDLIELARNVLEPGMLVDLQGTMTTKEQKNEFGETVQYTIINPRQMQPASPTLNQAIGIYKDASRDTAAGHVHLVGSIIKDRPNQKAIEILTDDKGESTLHIRFQTRENGPGTRPTTHRIKTRDPNMIAAARDMLTPGMWLELKGTTLSTMEKNRFGKYVFYKAVVPTEIAPLSPEAVRILEKYDIDTPRDLQSNVLDTIRLVRQIEPWNEKKVMQDLMGYVDYRARVWRTVKAEAPPPETIHTGEYSFHKNYVRGDRLTHPAFGEGTVLAEYDGKKRIRPDWAAGLKLSQMKVLFERPDAAPQDAPPGQKPILEAIADQISKDFAAYPKLSKDSQQGILNNLLTMRAIEHYITNSTQKKETLGRSAWAELAALTTAEKRSGIERMARALRETLPAAKHTQTCEFLADIITKKHFVKYLAFTYQPPQKDRASDSPHALPKVHIERDGLPRDPNVLHVQHKATKQSISFRGKDEPQYMPARQKWIIRKGYRIEAWVNQTKSGGFAVTARNEPTKKEAKEPKDNKPTKKKKSKQNAPKSAYPFKRVLPQLTTNEILRKALGEAIFYLAKKSDEPLTTDILLKQLRQKNGMHFINFGGRAHGAVRINPDKTYTLIMRDPTAHRGYRRIQSPGPTLEQALQLAKDYIARPSNNREPVPYIEFEAELRRGTYIISRDGNIYGMIKSYPEQGGYMARLGRLLPLQSEMAQTEITTLTKAVQFAEENLPIILKSAPIKINLEEPENAPRMANILLERTNAARMMDAPTEVFAIKDDGRKVGSAMENPDSSITLKMGQRTSTFGAIESDTMFAELQRMIKEHRLPITLAQDRADKDYRPITMQANGEAATFSRPRELLKEFGKTATEMDNRITLFEGRNNVLAVKSETQAIILETANEKNLKIEVDNLAREALQAIPIVKMDENNIAEALLRSLNRYMLHNQEPNLLVGRFSSLVRKYAEALTAMPQYEQRDFIVEAAKAITADSKTSYANPRFSNRQIQEMNLSLEESCRQTLMEAYKHSVEQHGRDRAYLEHMGASIEQIAQMGGAFGTGKAAQQRAQAVTDFLSNTREAFDQLRQKDKMDALEKIAATTGLDLPTLTYISAVIAEQRPDREQGQPPTEPKRTTSIFAQKIFDAEKGKAVPPDPAEIEKTLLRISNAFNTAAHQTLLQGMDKAELKSEIQKLAKFTGISAKTLKIMANQTISAEPIKERPKPEKKKPIAKVQMQPTWVRVI
jgi:hypothetical protein